LIYLERNSPKFVKIDGIETRYFEAGGGQPLVLVHGGGFGSLSYSANVWSLNFDVLARHFHVYALDKLGQGYTDNPASDSDYTMTSVIDHLYGFLCNLGINRASLLGHSRGALPVTRIAIDHPDRVSSLIILDSNTLAPDDPITPQHFYLDLEAKNADIPTKELVAREPEANSYSKQHITDDYLDALLEVARLPKSLEAKRKHNPANKQTNLRKPFEADLLKVKNQTLESIKTGDLKAPTLMVWGYNDPSAPVKLGIRLFEIISESDTEVQLHIINQAGHYVFREQAEAFNNVVTAFIRGRDRSRTRGDEK
jgi:2-hydroxy-6-oxonona-2,4-dienedioate hydrolase